MSIHPHLPMLPLNWYEVSEIPFDIVIQAADINQLELM